MQYHPVLENFAEYKTLRRDPVPYNKTAKFGLVPLMIAGRILNKSLRLKKIQKKQDLSGSFLAKLNLESQIIRNSQNQLVSLMTNSYIYSTLYIYNNSLRLLPEALHRYSLHLRCGTFHRQHCRGAERAQSLFVAGETQPPRTHLQSENTSGICKLSTAQYSSSGQRFTLNK